MASNPTITNTKTAFDSDTNPDIPVRTTEVATGQIQHTRLDFGTGAAEQTVSEAAPLPVGGELLQDTYTAVATLETTVAAPGASATNAVAVQGVAGMTPIEITGTVDVDPTGLATEAKQDTIIGHIDGVETLISDLDTKVLALQDGVDICAATIPTLATEATLSTLNGKVTACNTGAVVISSGTVTANIGTVGTLATEATLSTLNGKVTACNTGAVVVASGTVTANIGTVSTLATAANQTTIIGHLDGVEGLIGTTNTNTAASTTALQIMDDWDESDRCKVNIIAGQVGVDGGSGTVSALTQRVTLATNVALPTGSNTIGAVNIAAAQTLATVTTVGTLTNITNWGNIVDNAQFTDGTTRLMPGAYILDEVAGTALSENDAAAARIDSKRAQVLVIEDATTRGQRQAVSAAGGASVNLTQFAGTTLAAANPVPTRQTAPVMANNQISVGTSATLIIASNANRQKVTLFMHSTTDVFLGPSGVTTSNGALFAGTKGNQIVFRTSAAIYGIVASGTQTVSYIEEAVA